jgi:DNA-binding phage protein
MDKKFTRFDSASYLETEAEIAAYLEAAKAEAGSDQAFMAHCLAVAERARKALQEGHSPS